MSDLSNFLGNPFGKEMHAGYAGSFLNMRPAPEYASGEVILSSLYRAVGYPGVTEGKVPELGKQFADRVGARDRKQHVLNDDTWQVVLDTTLESPKLPSQSSQRFMLLCPVVPGVAAYSGSARLSKNSWNPGSLVSRMIRFGTNSNKDANEYWRQLYNNLSVDSADDPWSRLLQNEFLRWKDEEGSEDWSFNALEHVTYLESWQSPGQGSPAAQFVQDMENVMLLKTRLTRRQWISIVESLLRIASVSHILWLCAVNARAYDVLRDVLLGRHPGSVTDVHEKLFAGHAVNWKLGQQILPPVRRLARDYLVARVGINYLLYLVEEQGLIEAGGDDFGAPAWLHDVAVRIHDALDKFNAQEILKNHQRLVEQDPKVLACKKGIGKNIEEFTRHVLGHRQAADERLLAYDQGYYAKKSADYKSAPWVFSPGPVAVMMLCHCCTSGSRAPRTVEHLCGHLAKYGIGVKPNDLASSELGITLHNLGLVLDSPDAEGGMVVLDPFRK